MSPALLAMLNDIVAIGYNYWDGHGTPFALLQKFSKGEIHWHNDRMAEIHERK